MKKLFVSKGQPASRRGAFSAAATALAVAAVLLFNLLAGQLPDRYAQIDLSDNKIYTLSQTSLDYLAALEEDVEIKVLANADQVDSRIVTFLDKYTAQSARLSLEYIDPTVFPSALNTYSAQEGDVVVRCAATNRQETFAIQDIIGYDIYSYYTSGQMTETDFDCEGLLTSAIDGAVSAASRSVYQLQGHGEEALSESLTERLGKSHLEAKTLNLLTDGLPEDCDLLVANAPLGDLADDELTLLDEYVRGGGQLVYLMAADLSPRPNWDALLAGFGMTAADGLIADTQRYYQNNPYAIFPLVDSTADVTAALPADGTVLLHGSRGLTLAEDTGAITVTPFLSSSDRAVSVVDEANQTEGSYVLGAVATMEELSPGRLTVFASASLISPEVTERFTNLSNVELFVNALTIGFDDITNLSIQPVSLQVTLNTVTTGGFWSAIFVLVLPLAVLLLGFVRWLGRRKL